MDLLIDRSASMDNDQPIDDPIENLTKEQLALSVLVKQISAARREFLRLYCAWQESRLAYIQALLTEESSRRAVLHSASEADFDSAESSYQNAQLELERLEKAQDTADRGFLSG